MPAHVDTPLDFSTQTWYRTDGTARTIRSSSSAPSTTSSSSDSPSYLSTANDTTTTCSQTSKIGLSPTARRPRELRVKDDLARAHAPSASRERRISIKSRAGDTPVAVMNAPTVVVGPGIKPPTSASQLRSREQAARIRPKRVNGHERSPTAPAKAENTPRPELMRSVASEPSSRRDGATSVKLLPAALIVASSQRPRDIRRKPSSAHDTTEVEARKKRDDIPVEEQLRQWEARHREAISHSGVPPPPRAPVRRASTRVPDNTPTSSALGYDHSQDFDPVAVEVALRDRERARHAARVDAASLRSAGQSIKGTHAQQRGTATKKVLSSPQDSSKENSPKHPLVTKGIPMAKEAWEEPGASWYVTSPTGLKESGDNGQKQLKSWYRPAPMKELKPSTKRKGWLNLLF